MSGPAVDGCGERSPPGHPELDEAYPFWRIAAPEGTVPCTNFVKNFFDFEERRRGYEKQKKQSSSV